MDINWPQVWTLMFGVCFGILLVEVVRWLVGLAGVAIGPRKPIV